MNGRGLLISILVPGHEIRLISNDEGGQTYGGQQMVCSCGWRSRVIGISDNYQFSSLRRAAQRHEADQTNRPYHERVADLIDRQGWAHECKHGHPDCSLREGGHCADELAQRAGA